MYVSITVFQTAAQVLFCSVPLGFFFYSLTVKLFKL
jgi:hypothetical protein